jgi:hypothetical protein
MRGWEISGNAGEIHGDCSLCQGQKYLTHVLLNCSEIGKGRVRNAYDDCYEKRMRVFV